MVHSLCFVSYHDRIAPNIEGAPLSVLWDVKGRYVGLIPLNPGHYGTIRHCDHAIDVHCHDKRLRGENKR